MTSNSIHQFKIGIAILMLIIIIGTFGYELIEPTFDLIDSFYMTIITISTTGFKEVKPLSEGGKLFTIALIITGILTIAYTGGKGAQIIIEQEIFRRRKMSRKLAQLKDHYIVCGYGRMGRVICEGLKENGKEFVVIENNADGINALDFREVPYIEGDATSDETLISAGIERASGLVAVIKSDADNVFTALSAKELNPGLFVVARAIDEGTESKLKKAGADRVVKPYELGGNRMVNLLLKPGVMEFIDGVARSRKMEINLEEVTIGDNSVLIGKTLFESPIRKDLDIIIVAMHKRGEKFVYNPNAKTMLESGDKLIAIGETENLKKLETLCRPDV
jgi:voltage-gated potassium channel